MFIVIKGVKFYRPEIDSKSKERIESIRKEFNKKRKIKNKKNRDKKLPHFT